MRLPFINKITHIEMDCHLEETTLEAFSMGSLADGHSFEVECHLLLCGSCRERVSEADANILAMKRAAHQLPVALARPPWNFRTPWFAFAVLLLAVSVVSFAPADRNHSAAPITLVAWRGADVGAQGSSDRALLLQPDLNGLPAASSYRLEMVDLTGSSIWRGVLSTITQRPTAIVPAEPAGVYFVRVSLPSGELLREYSLELSRLNPSSAKRREAAKPPVF